MKALYPATAIVTFLVSILFATPAWAPPNQADEEIHQLVESWMGTMNIVTIRSFVADAIEIKDLTSPRDSIQKMVILKRNENGFYAHYLMRSLLNWVRSDKMTSIQQKTAVRVALVGALTYPANWGDANLGIVALQELVVSAEDSQTRADAVEALGTFGMGNFWQLNGEADFIINRYFGGDETDTRVLYQLKLLIRDYRPFVYRYGPDLLGKLRCGVDVALWALGQYPVRQWYPGGAVTPRWYRGGQRF